jgi:hypothetical protein
MSWIAAVMYLCMIRRDIAVVTYAQSTELSLGSFTMKAHNLAGEVVLLSPSILEVRGFVYDGTAPAVYFWADTKSVPSVDGFRLLDGMPTSGCGLTPIAQGADGTDTYRVEFPSGHTIATILGGSISVWCEEFQVSFGEVRLCLFLNQEKIVPSFLLKSSFSSCIANGSKI